MRSVQKTVAVFAVALFFVIAAGAQEPGSFAKPGVITSIGQNADAAIVKVLLNSRLKMSLDYNIGLKPTELSGMKTVIMVLGASAKGLGAAGVDLDQEIDRTKALLAEARKSGIKIIALHTGGANRRGKSSNMLIDIVLKDADAVIVVAAGNTDKYFDTAAKKPGVQVTETQTIAESGTAVQKLFGN